MQELVTYLSSLFGSAFSFVTGILVGVVISMTLLVLALFLLTKRMTKDEVASEANALGDGKRDLNLTDVHKNIPHPNIMRKGRFESYVWIVSADQWDITKPIHKFPPIHSGTGEYKDIEGFYAEVRDGILSFSRGDQQQRRQVLKIELEGCSCRIVRESLGAKQMWWRKAPLEISHSTRILYQGGKKLLMFCRQGADKEQWFISLSRHTEIGNSIEVIQHLYKRFSKRCRRKMNMKFPGIPAAYTKQALWKERVSTAERNTWFTPWRRGNGSKMPNSSLEASQTRPQPVELAEEIDKLWVGKKSHSAFREDASRRQIRLPNMRNGKNTKKVGQHSVSSTNIEKLEENITQLQSTSIASSSERSEISSPVQPENRDSPSLDIQPCRSGSDNAAPGSTLSDAKQEVPEHKAPESCIAEGVFGLNMFLARWAFDLVRNPHFEEIFRKQIVRRLGGLRRPDYLTPLKLCTFDMGANFPQIRSLRSLPPRGSVICPELLVDVSYAGGLEMTVETFLDLREGNAWGRLDRALTNWQKDPTESRMQDDRADLLSDMGADMSEDISDAGIVAGDVDSRDPPSEARREKHAGGFSVRKFAATKAKQLAERMADSISKIPLRLSVKVMKLEGTMLLWIAPPPSKRLWVSFLQEPNVEITAKPILANRVMNYSAAIGRVSSWLQRKMKQSFFSNLVFPNCADMSFPCLLGLTDDNGLRHPTRTVMNDLTYVSESESEPSDSELQSPPPQPISSTALPSSSPTSVPYADSPPSISSHENFKARHGPRPTALNAVSELELPRDVRLDSIRRHRYDTYRLNSFRKGWVDDQIPSRQSHGRRIFKRYESLSDGDISSSESEDEEDCVMSDCIEFFDAESTIPSSTTKSSMEEDLPCATTPMPVQEEIQPQEIKWPTSLPTARSAQQQSSMQEGAVSGKGSARRLGARLGDFVQSISVELEAASKRRSAMQNGSSDGNNNVNASEKSKTGIRRQKLKNAFGNGTAQLKNAGLSKLWGHRRNSQTEENNNHQQQQQQ